MAGFLDGELDIIAPKTTDKDLLGTLTTNTTGKKVSVETVLDSVFKYGGQLVTILAGAGVFKNKNITALQEIAEKGYNQNDVERLQSDIDLDKFNSLLDKSRSSSEVPTGEKNNTLLYLGIGALALVALYLITKSNEPPKYQEIEKHKR